MRIIDLPPYPFVHRASSPEFDRTEFVNYFQTQAQQIITNMKPAIAHILQSSTTGINPPPNDSETNSPFLGRSSIKELVGTTLIDPVHNLHRTINLAHISIYKSPDTPSSLLSLQFGIANKPVHQASGSGSLLPAHEYYIFRFTEDELSQAQDFRFVSCCHIVNGKESTHTLETLVDNNELLADTFLNILSATNQRFRMVQQKQPLSCPESF